MPTGEDLADLHSVELHLGVGVVTRPARGESTVTGAVRAKPSRISCAASRMTPMTTATLTSPVTGRAALR
ncbi:hypothetical protein [Mycolicibacterium thermoresistibile]|uniref:Putative ATP-binding component of ABC transporter n=1 Tax=Mycolicibacterium thermoresistibile TaxID=1797 RepID=A0A117IMF1_MYCTH|nr:hypothetical protein [Mycolicibacterium thermoresistibile]MCV7190298.1 hypothetical protein [Mycolicibacterium thermoresistibile]GAT15175.1 putative ATP-binding component of ABC transporter [Mycolicibacterium thermoresistibile]SNW18341.1 Uncharacterised protein [Mycolicibacterium thermoresistibile]